MGIGDLEKGKIAEYAVFGELLKRGAIPYVPLVDVEGIDAIIPKGKGKCIELQIKSTHTEEMEGSFNVDDLAVKPNFYIIGVTVTGGMSDRTEYEYWVFPSKVFLKHAQQIQHPKKGYATYRLDLWYGKRIHGAYLKDILKKYCNNWRPLVR